MADVRRSAPSAPAEPHVLDNGLCVTCADDEPDGPMDEQTQVLLTAVAELVDGQQRAFDPGKHARNPKGTPGAGRFRSMVDRLKDAITNHQASGGRGDPFKDFDREQLRRVAKTRGIALSRGEDRDSITRKLLDDLDAGTSKMADKAQPKPQTPREKVAQKPPRVPREPAPAKAVRPNRQARVVGHDMITNGGDADLARQVSADAGRYTSADTQLASIAAKQGFDGPPRVVSRSEMDRLTRDREPLFRGAHSHDGLSAAAMHEQTRTGPAWFGNGIFGNGIYFAVNEEKTRHYSDRTPVSMLRGVLDPEANVVSLEDLRKLLMDYDRKMEDDDPRWPVFNDPGRLAAALGYDGVRVHLPQGDGGDQLLVLNRTALILEEAE